jgi:hypothetical protein
MDAIVKQIEEVRAKAKSIKGLTSEQAYSLVATVGELEAELNQLMINQIAVNSKVITDILSMVQNTDEQLVKTSEVIAK